MSPNLNRTTTGIRMVETDFNFEINIYIHKKTTSKNVTVSYKFLYRSNHKILQSTCNTHRFLFQMVQLNGVIWVTVIQCSNLRKKKQHRKVYLHRKIKSILIMKFIIILILTTMILNNNIIKSFITTTTTTK